MKVLMWDFDGTLASREGMWSGTLVAIANHLLPERRVTMDEIRPFLRDRFPWHAPEHPHPHQSADEWWSAINPVFVKAYVGIGIHPEVADNLASRVRSFYLDESQWRVFDDVVPCLSSLQRLGWQHYILSNHVPELPQLAHVLGLSSFFVEVFSSGRTGYEKPHPEAFGGLLRQLPQNCTVWMIGDNLAVDVEGAARVGIPAILVRKKQDGARYYCDSLTGIERILGTHPLPISN
jgi:putative hydrolase of the HAD superfamily